MICIDFLIQVGWLGPYGLIPRGMDNEPNPEWEPVFVVRDDTAQLGRQP